MSRWRHALAVVGFFALVAGNIRAPAAAQPPVAITITAQPITSFDLRDSSRRQFGLLEFRGGLVLRSSFKHFGGISAIRVVPNGTNFIALSDKGWWLRGHILYDGPRPIAIADAEMAPMLGPDGRPLAARAAGMTPSRSRKTAARSMSASSGFIRSFVSITKRTAFSPAAEVAFPSPDHTEKLLGGPAMSMSHKLRHFVATLALFVVTPPILSSRSVMALYQRLENLQAKRGADGALSGSDDGRTQFRDQGAGAGLHWPTSAGSTEPI